MKAASGPVPCERVGGVPGRCLLRPGSAPARVQCPLLSSVTQSLSLGRGKAANWCLLQNMVFESYDIIIIVKEFTD